MTLNKHTYLKKKKKKKKKNGKSRFGENCKKLKGA